MLKYNLLNADVCLLIFVAIDLFGCAVTVDLDTVF